MGSGRVTDTPSPIDGVGEEIKSSPALISYTKVFCEQLPYYLAIGMTYYQFWEDDVCIAEYYREADNLKRKRKNEELWLQGLYIYNAIGDMVPVLHAFAGKGSKPTPYLTEPIPITEEDIREYNEREEKKKLQLQQAKMEQAMALINKKFNK